MVLDNPLAALLTPPLPRPEAGVLPVPARPGLGYDLDDAALERLCRRRVLVPR